MMRIQLTLELSEAFVERLSTGDFDYESAILCDEIRQMLRDAQFGLVSTFEVQEVAPFGLAPPKILWKLDKGPLPIEPNSSNEEVDDTDAHKDGYALVVQDKLLNEGQKAAVSSLLEWDETASTNVAVLTGGGGTGKTFTVAKLIEIANIPNPVFLAPTHEAKKALKQSLSTVSQSFAVYTVAQFLGKQPVIDDSGKESFAIKNCGDYDGFGEQRLSQLVVVDEASMIDTADYLDILDNSDRCLFVGDKAQLPPVGEDVSPVFSGEDSLTVELTRIMRSTGHLSDEIATSRASSLKQEKYVVQANGREIISIPKRDALDVAKELFDSPRWEEDPNFCRFLAFRNKIVKDYNEYFQPEPSPYWEGNRLKCLSPVHRLIWNRNESKYRWQIVANSSDNVRVISSPSGHSIEELVLEGIDYSGCNDLMALVSDSYTLFEVENPEGFSYYASVLSQDTEKKKQSLIKTLLEKLKGAVDRKKKQNVKKALSFLYKLGDQYSDLYCSTVHKSQGSSINHVFVDIEDLMEPPYVTKKREVKQSKDMRPSLLYTAFSRAREKLYLVR